MDPNEPLDWAQAPARPRLAGNVVHVWRLDLSAPRDDLSGLLAADERERAKHFAREEDRSRWTQTRGALRVLLARYVERDPRALRFVLGPHGKPALSEGPPAPSFNLSHSGDIALYAFALGCAVGVDVEVPRAGIDILGIAARALGADAARQLGALDIATREREFLRAWVRHEAASKCRGTGLGAAEIADDAWPLRITELNIGRDGAAALAIDGTPREIRYWALEAASAVGR
jgi:4'-phosphopantetheinyl transferase